MLYDIGLNKIFITKSSQQICMYMHTLSHPLKTFSAGPE